MSEFTKLSPYLVAEVINTSSTYFGESVYLTGVSGEGVVGVWYYAENLTGEFKVFFKESELEFGDDE